MNRRVIQFLLLLVVQYLLVLLHMLFVGFVPHPLNHFNLALCFLILFVVVTVRPQALWLSLPFIFFESIFSSLLFGVNLLALSISTIFFSLVLLTVLSNRSLPTIILSTIGFVFFYRVLLWLLLIVFNLFSTVEVTSLSWEWWTNVGWEVLFTTVVTSLVYFLLSLFLKRLRPEYITAIQKEYESKRYFR